MVSADTLAAMTAVLDQNWAEATTALRSLGRRRCLRLLGRLARMEEHAPDCVWGGLAQRERQLVLALATTAWQETVCRVLKRGREDKETP